MADYNKILRNGKNTLIPLISGAKGIVTVALLADTNQTLNGVGTIDSINYTDGTIICCQNQSTASKNGIYIARNGDWEQFSIFKPNAVWVTQGTNYGQTLWFNNQTERTIDTNNVSLVQYNVFEQDVEVFKVKASARTNITISASVVDVDTITINEDEYALLPNQTAVSENEIYVNRGGNWEVAEYVNNKPPKLIIVEEGTTDNIQSLWVRYSNDGSNNAYRNISRLYDNSAVLTGSTGIGANLTQPIIYKNLSPNKIYDAVIECDLFIFEEDPVTVSDTLSFRLFADGTQSQFGYGKYKRRLLATTDLNLYPKSDLLLGMDSAGFTDIFPNVPTNSNYWLVELRFKMQFKVTNESDLRVGLAIAGTGSFSTATILEGSDITIHEVNIN